MALWWHFMALLPFILNMIRIHGFSNPLILAFDFQLTNLRFWLPDNFNSDTKLFLANGIYFKADWEIQFDPKYTITGCFNTSSGCQPTYLMREEMIVNYSDLKDSDAKLVELPFVVSKPETRNRALGDPFFTSNKSPITFSLHRTQDTRWCSPSQIKLTASTT